MRRVLVVGLDGSTLDLLTAYAREHPDGAFARALEQGRAWTLRSTMPFFTAPAWTTFMTGLQPGYHGMYHWRGRRNPRTGERPLLSSEHLEEASQWWYLQRLGAAVSVSNFPMQYPAPVTQGRYLCGTLAPEAADNVSWPPELIDEVRRSTPGYRFEMDKGISYLDRPQELRDHILEVGRGHADAFAALLGAKEADFVVHVATITDRMHHFFWHHIDAAHPAHARAPRGLGNPIADAYAVAEQSLLTAWDAAPWHAVVLVSDHGAGRSTLALWVDAWLCDQGLATTTAEGTIDHAASIAYCGEEPECAVYVNRVDRDGRGVPAERYGAVVADLRERLLALELPGGGAALDDALPGAGLFEGPNAALGPDLVLVPADGVHPRPGVSPAVFTDATRLYSGHRPDGMLVVVAPGLKPGRADERFDMRQCFALTCALAGVPAPGGLSGTLPVALSTTLGAPEPDTALDWRAQVTEPPAQQDADSELISRLQELGYT